MRLADRLSRLEGMETRTTVRRVFAVLGGAPGNAEFFLVSQGIKATPDDLIIHRCFYVPSGAGSLLTNADLQMRGASC